MGASRFSFRVLSGFTLVEMLVVLVLLGLIAGSIIPNLGGTTKRTQIDTLIADLIDLDARARLLAEQHEACYFEYEAHDNLITLYAVDDQAAPVLTIDVPDFVELTLQQDGAETRTIVSLNRLGHTADYRFVIDLDQSVIQLRLNGITGWHELVREANP